MSDLDSKSATLAKHKDSLKSFTPPPPPPPTMDKEKKSAADDATNDEQSLKNDIEPVEDEEEYETGMRLGLIIVSLLLSIFLVSLDMTIVATAIPKITDEFQGLDLVGWYGSAFFLTVGAFQSTWGKAYKYFPLKTAFLLAIFVFELGSLICGVAPNSTTLIVGRAIAGLGGAGIASGAYTIIAFSVASAQRAAYTGLMGAAYGVASVVGPLIGGVFAEHVTWRMCFYINLPIGGVSAFIILIFFKTPSQAVPTKASLKEKLLQMDFPGTFIVMAAIICYILALQWGGQTKSWGDSAVIGTLVGFVAIFVLFGIVEWYQGERAMMVGRLFKVRNVSIGMAFIFFLGGGFFLLLYYLPIYFQVVSGVSASQSGVRNLPLILAVVIATIMSGGVISATGHFVPWLIVGGVLATIGSAMLYTLNVGSSSAHWIGYQILAGIGLGAAFQVPIIVGQATAKPSDLASVTAMILFCQTIGGAFFVSAGQVAFANTLVNRLPIHAPGVEPAQVIIVGVTEIRATFAADVVPGIIQAYMDGLKVAYAIAIGSAGAAALVGSASSWTNLKGKLQLSGAA